LDGQAILLFLDLRDRVLKLLGEALICDGADLDGFSQSFDAIEQDLDFLSRWVHVANALSRFAQDFTRLGPDESVQILRSLLQQMAEDPIDIHRVISDVCKEEKERWRARRG